MIHHEPSQAVAAERAAYKKAGRDLVIALAALGVLSALAGWLIAGRAGLLGALIGLGLAALFAAPTPFTGAASTTVAPTIGMGILMGAWVAKFAILTLVLALLRGHTWYHPGVLFATLVIGAILGLVSLARAVTRGRIPYVDPSRKE